MRGVLKPRSFCSSASRSSFHVASIASLGVYIVLALLTGACSKGTGSPTLEDLARSRVKAAPEAQRDFTNEGGPKVLSRKLLQEEIRRGLLELGEETEGQVQDLLVGFPRKSLGREHHFGGVVTATDGVDNETYGRLKLTDMTPIPVVPRISSRGERATLLLEGCPEKCESGLPGRQRVAEFPISAQDAENLYIDFSVIGSDMNLVEIMDPKGEFLHLKPISASTVEVSYSHETLLFDVVGVMEEKPARPAGLLQLHFGRNPAAPALPQGKRVNFTTRWYLKERVPNGFFRPQVATEGVGYFMTERFARSHAQKHAHIDAAGKPRKVHYFVKNVPLEHQDSFQQAFEDWNDTFETAIGTRLLTYEFVDSTDELADALVPGDVRVNVLEWDLVNQAPYGGLGPSIADQETGEMLSANILVQGPTIEKIYKDWFQVNLEARALRAAGLGARADALLKGARNQLFEEIQSKKSGATLALSLGEKLKFKINAQDPRLQDAAASKLDFEILPEGLNYDEYMDGYFRELVAHELGHNMGLRHNFRGNLFANNENSLGEVSNSIMEYLSRSYRHKNRIATYDRMAIAYGYNFVAPTRTDSFCTDEDVGDLEKATGSAECSRDDAENNPYEQLLRRLIRSRDLFIAKGTSGAPVWDRESILPHFTKHANGILLYGESAERSMETWVRFFDAPGRPEKTVDAVRNYVALTLAQVACEEGIEDILLQEKGEGTAAAQSALENLREFRKMSRERVQAVLGDRYSALLSCVDIAEPAALAQAD